jgi:F-type H+-transporting ATPase subunit gamma
MESTERLQRQLTSLDELRTIVKTMKALSAASIRQYERAVAALADYARTVELGLRVVLGDLGHTPETSGGRGVPSRRGAVVFGSDHGLCGRFNEDIAEHALEWIGDAGQDQRRLLVVGARAAASLAQQGQAPDRELLVPGSAARIGHRVQEILMVVLHWREREGVGSVYVYHNRPVGGGGYRPTRMRLLPVDMEQLGPQQAGPWPSRRLPTYTMDGEQLLTHLLRQHFFVSLFRACAESQASEHASRLAAMQAAERNLEDRLEEVTTAYRRARQDAITSELLDVVSGFEAIAGGAQKANRYS